MKVRTQRLARAALGAPDLGDCFNARCPSREVLAHVTGRWGSLIVAALQDAGVLRFSALRDRIDGISEKMLAQTLRELERDGLVVRTSRPVVPPHVEYHLSDLGAGVAERVLGLVRHLEAHYREFAHAQDAHDAERRSARARF